MHGWKNILFNICFFVNCLLVFLLLFENRLYVPLWMQISGRMHPMLLHFPIVLLIIYIFTFIVSLSRNAITSTYRSLTDLLLLLTALSSCITALTGLLLSREEGYDIEALQWHKWGGVGISVLTMGWYYFRRPLQSKKVIAYFTSLLALFLILITGHQGAGITHGQNFLLAPILPEKKQPVVPIEEAVVFTHMVKPILEAKCISCHNSKKAKGELVMETESLLLKGGKHGNLWDSTAPDLGLLLRRIHLPLEQKKHMPPQGKPQLTTEEIEIITQWIRKGSDFTLRVIDIPFPDTLRSLADKIFAAAEIAAYDFEEADPSVIEKLNSANRVIREEAINSPGLSVSFFNSQLFSPEQLQELSPVKKQIVSLDLGRMPVNDPDIKMIGEMENLRRLNLNFTNISGASLSELKKLKFLKSLSLSGTRVSAGILKQLQSFPQLKTVYTWKIPLAERDLEKIQQESKNIRYENGFNGDTIILKLTPPVLQNEQTIITMAVPLKLKHYIPGTIIRYTIDGSVPDSIHSPVFKSNDINPEEMNNSTIMVRSKAFKPDWISSDIMEAMFLKNTWKTDTTLFLTQPDSAYSGGSKLLTDLEKGTTNFRDGNWLAWRKKRMEVLMEFEKPVIMQSITLSSLIDVKSHIMPPLGIEIWGGHDRSKLKLLRTVRPEQPKKIKKSLVNDLKPLLKVFECKFKPAQVKYIKIIGTTVSKLPSWHPAKGQKGYIFVDEILVN